MVRFGQLYPAQQRIQTQIDSDLATGRPSRLIILKSRRHRVSTLIAANIFHAAIFNENRRGYIVAHDTDTSDVLFRMHRTFYDGLDDIVRPMVRLSNRKELLFENPDSESRKGSPGLKSSITVRAASSGGRRVSANQKAAGVGRGDRIDLLHASEVAFWPSGDATFVGFAQAVPDEPGTMVAIESTANGASGLFYEEWQRATSGNVDGYTPIFIPFFDHPEYRASFIARNRPEYEPKLEDMQIVEDIRGYLLIDDMPKVEKLSARLSLDEAELGLLRKHNIDWDQILWRRYCIKFKTRSADAFCAEYPSNPEEAFRSTGTPRFDNSKLKAWIDMCPRPSQGMVECPDDWAWKEAAWEAPELKFRESSRGWLHVVDLPREDHEYVIGADAGHGIGQDRTALAIFDRTEKRFVAYARDSKMKADKLAEYMVKAGWVYNCAWLAPESNGPGLLTTHMLIQSGYPKTYFTQRYSTATQRWTDSPGFNTDQKSRNLIIDRFDIAIETDSIECPVQAILEEAMTFVMDRRKGRADHLPGSHDDLLFSAMIAQFVDGQVTIGLAKPAEERQVGWSRAGTRVPDDLELFDSESHDLEFYYM